MLLPPSPQIVKFDPAQAQWTEDLVILPAARVTRSHLEVYVELQLRNGNARCRVGTTLLMAA